MVEFIRSINPGASPVANLSNRYFRPQLDDRESRALGQLANALARKRGALGGLADSYGALGGKFQQLSNAATSYQQDRLRDLQRQYDLQNKRDQLAFDQEQNQFKLAAEKQSLMLSQARSQMSGLEDGVDFIMSFQGDTDAIVANQFFSPYNPPRAGGVPVTTDPTAGSVSYVGPDALGFNETFGPQLEQASRITGADITVSDATHAGNTQFAALGAQVGADTKANLSLNNPGFINWIGSADAETQRKAFDIFGDDIVSGGTGLLNLDGVTRAVPKFRSMEDGIRYMGFWAQHRGVADGTVDKAVRQWFGVNAKGPVVATCRNATDTNCINQDTVDAYNLRMRLMADNGLQPDTPLDTREARDAFVRGTMRGEISGRNSEAILAAVPDMPLGKLFDEGQQAYQTGRLIRNNAKQYKLFNGSRDEYGPMQQGERRISLDFNSFAGKTDGFYALVVTPNNITGEERQAASAYSKGMVALMARYGYDDYGIYGDDGIASRSEIGRGKAGTFHTEPFFAQDPRAIALLENPEFMREYAELVEGTLGQIPGAVIMAPHEMGDTGAEMTMANGQRISERDFAMQRLMPLFGAEARGNTVNITASTKDGPLLLAGSDPNGMTVTKALAALGVPINLGSAQDIQSVGAAPDGSPSLNGLAIDGVDSTAAEFLTGQQALVGELRDRFQLAVDWARDQGHPNPVQFVMQRPGFRTMMNQFYQANEELVTDYQTQIIEDQKNSIESYVAEVTPNVLTQLDAMELADVQRALASMPGDNNKARQLILSLMSDDPETQTLLDNHYAGKALFDTKIGQAVQDKRTLAGEAANAQSELLEVQAEMEAADAAGFSYAAIFNVQGIKPAVVKKVVQSTIDNVNIALAGFEATESALTPADALEVARDLNKLRKYVEDDGFLAAIGDEALANNIAKAVERGAKLQDRIALNYTSALISNARNQQEVLAAYTSGLEFGELLLLPRDVNADTNFWNEIGVRTAARWNDFGEQQRQGSLEPIPDTHLEAYFDAGRNSVMTREVTTEVEALKKKQAGRLSSRFVNATDINERVAILQKADELRLTNVGTQIMQAAFGPDTALDLPQARDQYDNMIEAMAASGANPLELFSDKDGMNMMVLLQYDGTNSKQPHEILRDVNRQIASVPSEYIGYVKELNLSGVPMDLRNNVKGLAIVQAVAEASPNDTKQKVLQRMEKAIGRVVKTKKSAINANDLRVALTGDTSTRTTANSIIVEQSSIGAKPFEAGEAALIGASLLQKLKRPHSQIETTDTSGLFDITNAAQVQVSLSARSAFLTNAEGEPWLDIGGNPVGFISDDEATAQARFVTVTQNAQDAVTGEITAQSQRAIFIDSNEFLDLEGVGSIGIPVIGANGEPSVREVRVGELQPILTDTGKSFLKDKRSYDNPLPSSRSTVGYLYFVPDDVRDIAPGEVEIDNIPISYGLQGGIAIPTDAISNGLLNAQLFEVR